MFWVISVYYNIRNTLPKSGTFLLGHPVYKHISIGIFFFLYPSCIKPINISYYCTVCCLFHGTFIYYVRYSQWVLFNCWRFCAFILCVIVVSCGSCWAVTSPVSSSTFLYSGWPKFPPTFLHKQHFLPPVTSAPT